MTWRRHLRPELASLSAYHVPRPPGVLLDANESPFPPEEAVRRRLGELARDLAVNRYPEASAPGLRIALGARLGVDPDRVVVGNGSDELLSMLMTTFAGAPGAPARVLYPVPTFGMFGHGARALGLTPVEVPTRPDFSLDPAALAEAVRAHDPALVFLARPNNPTGALWPFEVVTAAAEAATGLVVVDEAYGPFAGTSALDRDALPDNVAVLQTLSKVGFAALRIGWCVCPPEIAREVDKARLPYNLNAFSAAVATEVVNQWDAWVAPGVARIVAERERLAAALAGQGHPPHPSRANLLLVPFAEPERVVAGLRRAQIRVRDLHRPGTALAGCLRITVGTPEENDRLLEALSELS